MYTLMTLRLPLRQKILPVRDMQILEAKYHKPFRDGVTLFGSFGFPPT